MTEQPGPPASSAPSDADRVQVDPSMVLTRVQQSGELGAALVRAGIAQVLAEHHAAEARELREQLAAARAGDAAPGTATAREASGQ